MGVVLTTQQRRAPVGEHRRATHAVACAGVLLGVVSLLVMPVRAHHALAAQYDMDKPVEISGTLKKMEFINPHSMLHLDVSNPDGTTTTWVFQTTNAGSLRKLGLARSGPGSLESGAKYTVKGFAARNGNPMGFLRVLVFPGGKEMTFWFGDPLGN